MLVVNSNRDFSEERVLNGPLYDTLDWKVLKIFFEGRVWRYHSANRDHTLHRWSVPVTALYVGSTGCLGQPIREKYVVKKWTWTHSCHETFFHRKDVFSCCFITLSTSCTVTQRSYVYLKYRQDSFRAASDSVEFSVKSSLQRYSYLGAQVYLYYSSEAKKHDAAAQPMFSNYKTSSERMSLQTYTPVQL